MIPNCTKTAEGKKTGAIYLIRNIQSLNVKLDEFV